MALSSVNIIQLVLIAFTSTALAGVAIDLLPSRHTRQTSDQCMMAGPLDYLYGYANRKCSCRSTSSCKGVSDQLPKSSNGSLCVETDIENRRPVSVTINITTCCDGQSPRSVGEDLTVEIWQANKYGTYSQRSGCAATLRTSTTGQVRFKAPVPGGVSFGADGADNVPHTSYGPVNIVVRGNDYLETTSVRLFYPGTLTPGLTARSIHHFRCNPGFNIGELNVESKCSFQVKMKCRIGEGMKLHEQFIKFREGQIELRNMENQHRPPVHERGCRKLMNMKKTYKEASVAMIVEICHPDGKGGRPCNDEALRRFVNQRQSFYLARPLSVLRDESGMAHDIDDERLGLLAAFRKQNNNILKENWAVVLDHHTEVQCCNELKFGEQYLVMGMPLPTVPARNGTLHAVRLWVEMAENTHVALRHLLHN